MSIFNNVCVIWMLHINENLYINSNSTTFFHLGIYSVDLYDSRWLVSPHIHSTCLIKIHMKFLSNAFKNILLKDRLLRSCVFGSVKFMITKFIWLHGFNILVRVIFMVGQTAPRWDQINKIIWVAHLLQELCCIVSLIPISTFQDLPLHYHSLLKIGVWVVSIQIYLICIFMVKGSRPSKDSKVTGKRVHFSPKQKWLNGY